MNLKIIIICLLQLMPLCVNAEDDPFDKTKPAPPRPERVISELPLSLNYQKKDGRHIYEIRGIYDVRRDGFDSSDYLSFIPECQTLAIHQDDHTCTFTTAKELSYSELSYAIDRMAEQGIGNIPYWRELLARDFRSTEKFKMMKCSIAATDEAPPEMLAWFDGPKNEELRIPLNLVNEHLCSLYILEAATAGLSSSRLSLRILDPDGKLIWKDDQTAYGRVKIALSGEAGSPMHKIWLLRDDNGVKSKFSINVRFEQDPTQASPPTSR